MKGHKILISCLFLIGLFCSALGFASTKFQLSIPTMTCPSCAASITQSLEKIGAISNVDVDIKNLKFSFETKPENEKLFTDASIMENVSKIAGFKVTEVKRITEVNSSVNKGKK